MSICVIPARGGSQRIPRKNIKPFLGRPMIAWSVEAAQKAGCFERIIVSTDDEEIAQVAISLGAEIPFIRASTLADEITGTLPVIADAITKLQLSKNTPVCCLYPAAPFVEPDDLRLALEILRANDAYFVLPVTTFSFPIQRALRRSPQGRISLMQPKFASSRSQDLEEGWHDAGQFYWGLAKTWQSSKSVFDNAHGIEIPRHRVQDIDTFEDWIQAEAMKRALNYMSLDTPNMKR